MAFYLLDTNHLSPLVTRGNPLSHVIVQYRDQGDTLGIATPALAEMLFGILQLPRANWNLAEWQKYADTFAYYEVDRAVAEQSALLRVGLRRRGRQLDVMDSLIATIALLNDLILVTTDQDFDAVPGLQLENWLR